MAGEIRARYEQGWLSLRYPHRCGLPCGGPSQARRCAHGGAVHCLPLQVPRSVLEALGYTAPQNDFEAMQELEAATGRTAPASLAALRQKAERFNTVIDPEQIAQVALSYQE